MKQKLRPKKIERFHLPAMWQSYSYVCVGNKDEKRHFHNEPERKNTGQQPG